MIKRHAFSFIGWLLTFLFAYMWRANVDMLHEGIKLADLTDKFCSEQNAQQQKSEKIKPIKIMIAMQYINPCEQSKEDHCEDYRLLKKAFLRNYYHKMDREWEQVDITFKFFLGEKEYRSWMKTGRDRIFRDARMLSFDYQYHPGWKTMPFGLLLSFGTTSNLFHEKVFDFDVVFALDDKNGVISRTAMENTLNSLKSYDVVVLRKKQTEQYQLALGYKALLQVAHHSFLRYPEHPLERNYSVISGFNMMHKILQPDIKEFQNYFDHLMTSKELKFFRDDVLEPNDINPVQYYYGMSNEKYFQNSGFKKYEVKKAAQATPPPQIGFKMTPPDSCNFGRKNASARHLVTTFVLQTRLEILQRKLFRERAKEMDEYYSADENAVLDNFYVQLMGRANRLELFEIARQLLQDDYNFGDIVVANFTEEHERIKFDRQAVSYLHQSAIEYAYRCREYEKRPTDFVIMLRAGRIVKTRELLHDVVAGERALDPEKPTIICLENFVIANERPNLFANDRYILPGQFPLDHHYPPHCMGSYLLTRAAVQMLYKHIGSVERNDLRMEDVFITGMVREAAGLSDIRATEEPNLVLRRLQELVPFF